jgi:uncharacterized protein YndB with AHSA1/START domain
MSQVGSIKREMMIEADNGTVFTFFTVPELLVRWIGVSATLDPKPGGLFLIKVQDGFTARGTFTEVVPVSHLAYTWGWEGNKENVPPGSSIVEIDLSTEDGHTLLCFTHRCLPPEAVPSYADSWSYYLRRLAMVAIGKDPRHIRQPRRSGARGFLPGCGRT